MIGKAVVTSILDRVIKPKQPQPLVERDDGSLEPEETIDLKKAEPVFFEQVLDRVKEFVPTPIEVFYNMPVIGGFSIRQVEEAHQLNEERDNAFKWFIMGMPDDLASIEKAETSRYADLVYDSPITYKAFETALETAPIKMALQSVIGPIGNLIPIPEIPDSVEKETAVNFAIESASFLAETFTDPAQIIMMYMAGKGIEKGSVAAGKFIQKNAPEFWKMINTPLFQKQTPALRAAYKKLGVKPDASATQVNKAYRAKAMNAHPDRGGTAAEFDAVQQAYKVYTDFQNTVYKQLTQMSKRAKFKATQKYKASRIGNIRGEAGKGKDLIPKGKDIGYHGSPIGKDIKSLKPSKHGELGAGIYFSKSVDYATKYLTTLDEGVPKGKASIVEIDMNKLKLKEMGKKEYLAKRGEYFDAVKTTEAEWDGTRYDEAMNNMRKDLIADGYDGIHIEGEKQGVIFPEAQSKIVPPSTKPPVATTGAPPPPKKPPVATSGEPVGEPDGFKERGFVTSVKAQLPKLKVSGQYIPRPTDELSMKARNLIKDDIKLAETMANEGTDDASIAVGAELLKYYSQEAEKAKSPLLKDSIYEKAAELGNSLAERLTELGRSVQAASILSRLTPEGQVKFAARTIQKYNIKVAKTKGGEFKQIPELTGQQTKEITTWMNKIQAMPEGQEKAMQFKELQDYISNLVPTPLMDKIIAIWKAGLLTGIRTHEVNIFSNIAHGVSEVAKDAPAAVVDKIASLFTGKRTVVFTLKGFGKGLPEGFKKGWEFLKTGYDERNALTKYDYKKVNLGKSKVGKALQKYVDNVFGALGAGDQTFYYGARLHSMYSQAKAASINAGLKGKEATKFIQNLINNPTDEMLVLSVADATIAVYQNATKLGDVAKALQKIPNIGEFILPFGRTPSAVATQILNYTPVGAVKTLMLNIGKGKFNQREFAQGFGRAITGTAVLGLGVAMYKAGKVVLDRPKTESERKRWELEGKKANTIKVGDTYRSIQVLGPAGNVILIGAHFAKAFEENGSVTMALAQGAFGGIKSFTEQTFLQGIKSITDAMNDPENRASAFIKSFVASGVPTIVKDVATAIDPKVRRAQTITQKIIARMPILRQTLEPSIDVFGQELKRGESFWATMADPTRPRKMKSDPIVKEIRRLVTAKHQVSTTQVGDRFGYDILSPEQNTTLMKKAGQIAYNNISEYMRGSNYSAIPDEKKATKINRFLKDGKDKARIDAAIDLTQNLEGKELNQKIVQIIKDGLLTRELYKDYLRLR